eukprot:6180499-Pleurochrysis_carterae.AAC.4
MRQALRSRMWAPPSTESLHCPSFRRRRAPNLLDCDARAGSAGVLSAPIARSSGLSAAHTALTSRVVVS